MLRHSADEVAKGGDIDHRLRSGGRREDSQHLALQEGHIQNPAPSEQGRNPSLHPSRCLAHRELQPNQPHDPLPGPRSCNQGHPGVAPSCIQPSLASIIGFLALQQLLKSVFLKKVYLWTHSSSNAGYMELASGRPFTIIWKRERVARQEIRELHSRRWNQ